MLCSLLLSLLIPVATAGPVRAIEVRNQQDFDGLGKEIQKALDDHVSRVEVTFRTGTYFFSENHINLDTPDAPNTTVFLDGNGSILLGKGDDYQLRGGQAPFAGKYLPTDGFYSVDNGKLLSAYSLVRKAQSVVVSAGKGIYRMKVSEKNLDKKKCKDVYVVLSEWYRSHCYPVVEIKKGYLYFKSEDSLEEMNWDIRYGQTFPKYVFVNHPKYGDVSVSGGTVRSSSARIHRCVASTFLRIWSGRLGRMEVRNFTFAGNGGREPLMMLYCTAMKSSEFSHCRFSGIQNRAVSVHRVDNASIHDNVLENCFRETVFSDMFARNTEIYGNRFTNMGCAFEGTAVIRSEGGDMHVRDNYLEDFTYIGILVGVHYTNDQRVITSGCIERNELCQSDAFRKEPSRTLMDCGAIYVRTMNVDVLIRNNYIHDYSGTKDYRGIFGDDGASHVTVTGNLITDIPHGNCIDFRRVPGVLTLKDSYAKEANVYNRIEGNQVDGNILFETWGGDDGCYRGVNPVLRTELQKKEAERTWRRAGK